MKHTLKTAAMLLLGLLAVVSCKDQEDVKPQNVGSYLIWTDRPKSNFDKIVVNIDGKHAGDITATFDSSKGAKPDCGTPGFVKIDRPAGSYKFEAIRYLNGKIAGVWDDETLVIEANTCKRVRLN